MPDHPKPNVFAPEFLQLIGEREPPPFTTPEARWAGPWRVEERGEKFAVVRESGGEPEAVTHQRETALLLAAIFPVVGRDLRYWLEREEVDGQPTIALKTVMGKRGFVTVGRLQAMHEDLVEPLSVAEYLLRSATALALLLEAAPLETLEQAGTVLARRMLDRSEPDLERPSSEETRR